MKDIVVKLNRTEKYKKKTFQFVNVFSWYLKDKDTNLKSNLMNETMSKALIDSTKNFQNLIIIVFAKCFFYVNSEKIYFRFTGKNRFYTITFGPCFVFLENYKCNFLLQLDNRYFLIHIQQFKQWDFKMFFKVLTEKTLLYGRDSSRCKSTAVCVS
ncbi:hypothetical protein RFI_24264 [Reticulomyxa filosa]|uniref:Uncharacterized protein n=1 Tax=Reticulomyxa filosa TaxID=46433 RepID=X6MJ60_RETFI|nr:hypothetical protein RFI_24264 [Reticulomyxa filosa]|eukprot:ETO13110.1 hypothetical protein RFI_24264 [Reticulomyxa filosa]